MARVMENEKSWDETATREKPRSVALP